MGRLSFKSGRESPVTALTLERKKVRVLKIAEKPKAHKDRERQKDLRRLLPAELFNQQAETIALHDGDEHEQHIFRLAPGIEKEACEQQHRVFSCRGAAK